MNAIDDNLDRELENTHLETESQARKSECRLRGIANMLSGTSEADLDSGSVPSS